MQNLNSQSKDMSLVINESTSNIKFSVEFLLKRIQQYLKEKKVNEYYYILHDKDVNDEGELKTRHIHLLYQLPKRVRFKTELSSICDFLFGDSKYVMLISIEKWRYHDEGIQYLCHKNNPEKYQYPVDNVFTSDTDYVRDVMAREIDVTLRMEDIVRICWECDSIVDVYMRVGLKNSKLYSRIIENTMAQVKADKRKKKLETLYSAFTKESSNDGKEN